MCFLKHEDAKHKVFSRKIILIKVWNFKRTICKVFTLENFRHKAICKGFKMDKKMKHLVKAKQMQR